MRFNDRPLASSRNLNQVRFDWLSRGRWYSAAVWVRTSSVGNPLLYGFSVFIKPIADNSGWNRATIAAMTTPVALVLGPMMDRWPALLLTAGAFRGPVASVPGGMN